MRITEGTAYLEEWSQATCTARPEEGVVGKF